MPGTARSSASAGRSLIITSAVTWPRACCRARARGTRNARPVRRQATSSRLSAPRLCDVERLVDRLVADPHGLIIGEIDLATGSRSAPGSSAVTHRAVPAMGLVASLPLRGPAAYTGGPSAVLDHARQPVLHVLAQPFVGDQLGDLGPTSARSACHCAVDARTPAARSAWTRCGATPGRSSTGAAQPPGDLADTALLGMPDCDVLALRRTTSSDPTPSGQDRDSRRQRDGTTVSRPRMTRRPQPRRPRTCSRARSPPRTGPGPAATPPSADPAMGSAPDTTAPPAAARALPCHTSTTEVLRRPVESAQGDGVDMQQVAGQDRVGLCAEELGPGRSGTAGSGVDPGAVQDRPDGRGTNPVAEPGELAVDAAIPPGRILGGQAQDQRAHSCGNGGTTRPNRRGGPAAGEELPVPAQDGGGRDDQPKSAAGG